MHRFFQSLRRRRADAIEERDWRRRLVLASRKIQSVHHELTEDISDVRGLKGHLESARPEMERLENALAASREVFDGLQEKLHEHAQVLTAQIGAVVNGDEVERAASRVRELEAAIDERDATVRELRAQIAALLEEQSKPEPEVGEASLESDDASVLDSAAQSHVANLELQLRSLETVREDLAQAFAELEDVRENSAHRVARLELRLTEAEDERATLVAAHESALAEREQLEAQSRARTAELEAEVQAANDYNRAEEERRTALEDASAAFETQLGEMQTLVEGLEVARDTVEDDTAAELAENTARILELEAYCRDLQEARKQAESRGTEASEAEAKRELLEITSAYEEQLGALRERLRQSEITRLEIETRSMQEMTDFADHTRVRISRLTSDIAERDERVSELDAELVELRRRHDSLQRRTSDLNALQAEVRVSSKELEVKTARLLDLMRSEDAGDASVEHAPPVADAVGVDEPTAPLPHAAPTPDGSLDSVEAEELVTELEDSDDAH